jgi:uncharacterized protein
MKRVLILLLGLFCCACIQLGGPPQELDFYRLKSATNTTPISSTIKSSISIKIVDFPDFLDRLQIVTHDQNHKVQISPKAFWAEPLADSLVSVLRQNLKQLFPMTRISLSPWETEPTDAIKVELLINDFSGTPDNSIWVDIDWAIRKGQNTIEQGHFTQQQMIGESFDDLSAALSRSLSDLSQLLAEKLIATQ